MNGQHSSEDSSAEAVTEGDLQFESIGSMMVEDLDSATGSPVSRKSTCLPPTSIGGHLAAQLESAQHALAARHEQIVRDVTKSMEGCLQASDVGAEVKKLRAENKILRTQLSHHNGHDLTQIATPEEPLTGNGAEQMSSRESSLRFEAQKPEPSTAPILLNPCSPDPTQDLPMMSLPGQAREEEKDKSLPFAITKTDTTRVTISTQRTDVDLPATLSLHNHKFGVLDVWCKDWSIGDSIGRSLKTQRARSFQAGDDIDEGDENAESPINVNQSISTASFERKSGTKYSFAASGRGATRVELSHGDSEEYSRRLPIHPYSPIRGAWDCMSLVLVMYDIIYLPLQLFDPPEIFFTDMMSWVTRLFWTFDMIMSFISGYVTVDGFIEMRMNLIVRRYLSTWFALDTLIVSVEWVELVTSTTGLGYAKAAKASRTFRIIRLIRLLRLARMREVFELFTERINSDKVLVIADMIKHLIALVGLGHFIACVWYGIGARVNGDGDDQADGNTWVKSYHFDERSLAAKYFMSLHWSLSQLAGGMDEITPENVSERVYCIAMFLLSFVLAVVFLSSMTSSMTQLQFIGNEHKQAIHILRKYLSQNGISSRLALRVQRNANHTVNQNQKLMPEENVLMLKLVSEPMLVELHFEMYAPLLRHHHFFDDYIRYCPQVMRKVCHLALSHQNVANGDVIFSEGEMPKPPKMYIVTNGTLSYTAETGTSVAVMEGQVIAEATLWTLWMHRGALTATADCRLTILNATIFQSVAGQFHHTGFDPKDYAAAYVKELNSKSESGCDLTDLEDVLQPRGHALQRFAIRAFGRNTESSETMMTDEFDNRHTTGSMFAARGSSNTRKGSK